MQTPEKLRTLAIALGMAVLVLVNASAAAQPSLPPGWAIEDGELVWTSDSPLRMGGARYEFRSGERLLGYPLQRGNTLRLRLERGKVPGDFSVWAGARRIDAGAPARRAPERARVAPRPPGEDLVPTSRVDPAAPGLYRTRRFAYRLPGLLLEGYPAPIEVLGEVTVPVGSAGPLPLVLFLHGRHSTCYRRGPRGEVSGLWPCPRGWRPVPSHTGFRYIAEALASKRYLAVSIAANGVNAQDGILADGGASARAQLVRHHLALWAKWSAGERDPWGGRFAGGVNLDEVVLVGHSRGGEGVVRATLDTAADDPWRIRGLVLIGPTAFGRQVAPGVPTTAILPFCDGDVASLEGQQYIDIGRDLTVDTALRTSVVAMGTNHNYYNTEWTPGLSRSPAWDDWFDPEDPQCGESGGERLTPGEQQRVGLAYTAALVELAIAEDPAVLPLLDGTRVKPASIGRATTFVHALGGAKRLLYAAGASTRVSARDLTARECRGYFLAGPFDLRTGCTPDLSFDVLPHWIPMSFAETAPAPKALRVAWRNAGGSVQIPVTRGLDGAQALDFRIAGEPGAPPVELTVRVRDDAGAVADLEIDPLTVDSYFGPSPLGKVLARQLRASLEGVPVQTDRIASIELIPRSAAGRFWLLDVASQRDRLVPSEQIHLPRVSVGDAVVPEGDFGEGTVELPVTIEGEVMQRATLWVQLTDYASTTEPTRGFPLVLEPGTTSATIPVGYRADDIYNPFPQLTQVTLVARRNAVTGDFDATALVVEDEPAPRLTVDAADVTTEEGGSLSWTLRLSAPMANPGFWFAQLVPVGAHVTELDTDDVPGWFLENYGITPPVPAVPLSELEISLNAEFPAGVTEVTLSIPIAPDGKSEPPEGVALRLDGFGDPVVPVPIELTGAVPAN